MKSTSNAEDVRGLAYATAHGASESIFAKNRGRPVRGGPARTSSASFGDEVVTPPLAAGALAGITREVLLEWVDVVERDLTVDEAKGAGRGLHHLLAAGRAGGGALGRHRVHRARPRTQRIADVFAERSTADLEP